MIRMEIPGIITLACRHVDGIRIGSMPCTSNANHLLPSGEGEWGKMENMQNTLCNDEANNIRSETHALTINADQQSFPS